MTRTFTIMLLWIAVLPGVLLAVHCPEPEDTCADPPHGDCAAPTYCWVNAEWFAKYEGCSTGHHNPIKVEVGYSLVLYTDLLHERRFKAYNFKKGDPIPHHPDECDFTHAREVADFTESPITRNIHLNAHSLNATQSGCYEVTLEFDDGCRVDPHIIVNKFSQEALKTVLKEDGRPVRPTRP